MKRREFITLLGSAAAVWPLATRAQQAARRPTIGYMGANTPSIESPRTAAFMQRLHELGWIEGRNVAIEYRWAEGRNERFAEIAAEFVQLKVEVIVTAGTAAVVATGAPPTMSTRFCAGRSRPTSRSSSRPSSISPSISKPPRRSASRYRSRSYCASMR
jgi:hypothetical protein